MYKERKTIVVDSCDTCPLNGKCKAWKCKAWKALTKQQKLKLAIGDSAKKNS